MSYISFSQVADQYDLASQVQVAAANAATALQTVENYFNAPGGVDYADLVKAVEDGTITNAMAALTQFTQLLGGGASEIAALEKTAAVTESLIASTPVQITGLQGTANLMVDHTVAGTASDQPLTYGLLAQLLSEGKGDLAGAIYIAGAPNLNGTVNNVLQNNFYPSVGFSVSLPDANMGNYALTTLIQDLQGA